MSYSWSILEAAVEQYILFPSKESYCDHINRLRTHGKAHEIVWEKHHQNGSVTAVIRKQYNNIEFLSVKEEESI